MAKDAEDPSFDDAYLVRQAQEGYIDAYEQLVERHSAGVYALALRIVGDRQAAQDLAQDSFLAAFRALPRFRRESSFKTWLYRLVTNRCLNHLRRHPYTEPLPPDGDRADGAPGPADSAVRAAQMEAVRLAVSALPPAQRIALVLSEYEGLSYQDIADITDSTVPAVRSQLFRARRALAERLAAWR